MRLAGSVLVLLPFAALSARCCHLANAVLMTTALARRLPIPRIASGERTAQLVDLIAARVRVRCLTKALVLHVVLARLGTASQIVVGAALQDGQLRSHAWVEREGHSPLEPITGWTAIWRVGS